MAFGYYFLLSAFVLTVYAIWAGVSGLFLKNSNLIKYAKGAIYGQFTLVTLAIVLLAYALFTRDFSIRYVAEYTDRKLPLLYTFSALWAGQAGSLLFWTWLLTMFGALFVFVNRKQQHDFIPYVFTILNFVSLFFLSLVIFSTNPFEKLNTHLPDGFGLNPLLQNVEMIFHPPTLFLGFVGFTIPFAFALAALMIGDLSSRWIDLSRNWSLVAWLFLTIGNLLGAQWAYVELGWGGYWAWDPVENASLLPWLTGTAFIHSLMAQKSRDMMKAWNVSLVITTFLLTILGTFITRSGIISSVHAFGISNLGTFFLVFMALVLVVSVSLIFWRRGRLTSENKVTSLLSREFSFLLNNVVFVVLMVTILWGTLYPAFTELFIGKQITLGEKFFNKVAIPFGTILLFVLAICPLLFWRQTKKDGVLSRVLFSLSGAALLVVALLLSGIRHGVSLIILGLGAFAVMVILSEFFSDVQKRKLNNQENFWQATGKVLGTGTRKYTAYLIHFGVILIYLSIIGTTVYKQEKEITLKKGESVSIGRYELVFQSIGELHEARKDILLARMEVFNNKKKIGEITPERFVFKSVMGERQVTSEVALRSTLREDLYVSLASLQDDESATFVVMVNPLMNWMWIGGFVITFGIVIILIDVARKGKREFHRQELPPASKKEQPAKKNSISKF